LDSTLEFTVGEASSCPGCATPQHYNGCHTSLGRRPFIPQVRARGAWVISKALSADGRLTCTFTLKAICLDKTVFSTTVLIASIPYWTFAMFCTRNIYHKSIVLKDGYYYNKFLHKNLTDCQNRLLNLVVLSLSYE
jgi:hypothetical protein